MEEQQEQVEASKNQLLEIYKLHTQIVNNISNRRKITNRFYQVVLSGLTLILLPLLQHKKTVIPEEMSIDTINMLINMLRIDIVIESFTIFLGFFGSVLSAFWSLAIDNYLRVNSRKYEVLKKLETKLEYQFFTEEWKLLGKKEKDQTYRGLASTEKFVPLAFNLFFLFVTLLGIFKTGDWFALVFFIFSPILLILSFVRTLQPDPWTKSSKEETPN